MATCNASARITTTDGNPFAGDPVIFHTPPYVETTHLLSIRLGRTNNVTVLLDGTQEQQIDYVEGIFIAAVACFVFFTLWLVLIFIFKCCGHKRVGFFSGQRIRRPMPPTPPREEMASFINGAIIGENVENTDETDEERASRILAAINKHNPNESQTEAVTAAAAEVNVDCDKGDTSNDAEEPKTPKEEPRQQQEDDTLALNETDSAQETQPVANQEQQQVTAVASTGSAMLEYREKVEEWQRQVKRAERVQRRIRVFVLFCCIGVIVSAILMLVNGVDALMNSLEDVQVGLGQMSGLATSGIALIDQFVAGQNTTINATESMLLNLNEVCPLVQEQLCADILTAQDCNYTGIPNEQEIQELVEYYSGVKEMVYEELDESKNSLQEIIDFTAYLEKQVGSFNWAFYVSAVFASTLAVLTLFIIIGIVLAWNGKLHDSCFRWVRNLVVVPIFVLLVFLSLLFSCVFVVGSITTSDVCYDSPDPLVLQLLSEVESEFNAVPYRFLIFYVSGCPANQMPLDMNSEVNELMGYLELIQSFLNKLQNNPTLLDACGVSESGLINSLADVAALICFLSTMVLDVRDFFNCNNWNPVYATFAYDAVCYNATRGFVWISSTQFAIVFFAMMIVMLRVACYEIEDEEDFQNQRRWCARLCCCFASSKEKDENDDGLKKPPDASTPSNNIKEPAQEPAIQEEECVDT